MSHKLSDWHLPPPAGNVDNLSFAAESMEILNTLKDWFKPAPPPDPEIQKALGRVCALVDPMLNTLPALDQTLQPVLAHTLNYCQHIVGNLPGPFEIDRQAFSVSPLVHALFATVEDIALMLAKSQEACKCLLTDSEPGVEFVYAMLAARWQRKKGLGMALDGEMLQADALIETLIFADHVLVQPADSLEATREKLCQTAFDSLLKTFRVRLIEKRNERALLQEEKARERDQINVMRSMGKADKLEEHTRRLQDVETRLRENIEALRPENIIAPLTEFLAAPEKALRLEAMRITVDRSGIVAGDDQAGSPGQAETLDFQEIIGRDRRRYVGMLVKIRRSDVLEAAQIMKDVQQRYLII